MICKTFKKQLKRIRRFITCRNVFYCNDCDETLRMNNKEVTLADFYNGPYCPKCGKK